MFYTKYSSVDYRNNNFSETIAEELEAPLRSVDDLPD